MKKRSLFKRLLSGFVATALAATICFGDRVFGDLFASAAGDDPAVKVMFRDGGEPAKAVNEEGDNTQYEYYVLGVLFNKGEAKSIKEDNVADFVAWDWEKIDPTTTTDVPLVVFDNFREVDAKNYKTSQDSTKPKVAYDANKYDLVVRVFRYWVLNAWGGKTTNPHVSTEYGVEPTNLISPEGSQGYGNNSYNEQSSDSMPGYVPSNTVEGNLTTVIFDKQNVEFYLDVNFSKSTTITADDQLYALVQVLHTGGYYPYYTYYYQKLETSGDDIEHTVQGKVGGTTVREWMNDNGTVQPNEQFHGNDSEIVSVRLFKAEENRNLGNLLKGEGCTELKTGDFAKAQKVNIKGVVKDGDNITKKYYAVINFEKLDESDNYDYKDILGSGVAFGITADRLVQGMHTQTNFATNYFKDKADNADVDLTKPSAGEIYVPGQGQRG